MENVKIEQLDEYGKLSIKFPKGFEEMYLAGLNLTLEDIQEIVYEEDSYIGGFIPMRPMNYVSMTINIDKEGVHIAQEE